jgi:hypothetical protein
LKLKGGLGNQLFQLGAAIRLAKGNSNLILLDTTTYLTPQQFKLPLLFTKRFEFKNCSQQNLIYEYGKFPTYLIGDNEKSPFIDQSSLDAEIDLSVNHVLLDGYFQSGKNIGCLKDSLDKNCYNLEIELDSYKAINEIVIHYRQGDYLRPDVQATLGLIKLSYIDRVLSDYIEIGATIKIYSDELGLLARYQDNKNILLKIGGADIDVFRDLMKANCLCVPNSSFSVTAAWLSNSINLLIRPERWSKKYDRDELTNGFIPEIRYVNNWFY